MTTFGGQSSTSLPAEGEMVGIGARRKNLCRSDVSCHSNTETQNALVQQNNSMIIKDDTKLSSPWLQDSGLPENNSIKRREKRHVYHDIIPLKSEKNIGDTSRFFHDAKHEQEEMFDISSISMTKMLQSKSNSVKPEIPPKPKFILRNKGLRHVYQTIQSTNTNSVQPPPLPVKPLFLNLLRNTEELPPPLPPRVANVKAIEQRHKLDQEYFENLRKNVDEHLLDLAEEGDLPVTQNHLMHQDTRRLNYGAHSPPLFPEFRGSQLTHSMTEISPRRYSLPLYECIADNANLTPVPPVRVLCTRTDMGDNDDRIDEHHGKLKESSRARIAQNLQLLRKCGWYWGNMTWQEAETLLAEMEGEGVFLMRDSQNPLHLLTITVRSTTNTVHHIRVEYSDGKFQLYEPGRTVSRSAAQCVRHSNIEQFIKLAIKHSTSGSFLYFLKPKNMGEPPVQIRLLTPISRLLKVKTLQYLCRMTVRNCVVSDSIPSITVPLRIKQYLQAGPYYDPREAL